MKMNSCIPRLIQRRDQTQTWSYFSPKFPLSLQIPLGSDLKSGIQIRTSSVTRGWWNIVRASGFSLQLHSKRWQGLVGFRSGLVKPLVECAPLKITSRNIPIDTLCSCDVESTSLTLIQRCDNVVCPLGYYTATDSTHCPYSDIDKHRPDHTSQLNQCIYDLG